MTTRHASPRDTLPGDGLVRVGAVVFVLGVVAGLVSVVPSVVTGDPANAPLVVAAGSLLPLGLGLALLGLLRAARTRRRETRASR